jgi:Fe-S cluster biogenesis protein NfuA
MSARLREGPQEFNAGTTAPSSVRVRAALDRIRPGLIADGGNVELASIEEDGTAVVELQGECSGCPAAEMTVRLVIEPHLRHSVPGITNVVAI